MQRQIKEQIIIREKSSYGDIFQKRPTRYRLYETIVYGVVMILLAQAIPSHSLGYKIVAVVMAAVIIGGAPIFYRWLLAPEYTLKKTELMIQLRNQVRHIPITETRRASEWKALFQLNGKKESLMVSKNFLDKLDDQIEKIQRTKKR